MKRAKKKKQLNGISMACSITHNNKAYKCINYKSKPDHGIGSLLAEDSRTINKPETKHRCPLSTSVLQLWGKKKGQCQWYNTVIMK